MFKRQEVNIQDLKDQGLQILPTKIEHEVEQNEIWIFGLTERNQTALIRVNQFSNLFYIILNNPKQTKENNVHSLEQILKKQFKNNLKNITENIREQSIVFKVVIENQSLLKTDLQTQIDEVDFDKSDLFRGAQIFIPEVRDQFIIDQDINSKTFLTVKVDGKSNSLLEEQKGTRKKGNSYKENKISTCQIEVLSKEFKPLKSMNNQLHKEISQNQLILITDIENLVLESGFDAEKIKKNPIFMISNLIFKNGESSCTKQIFTTSEKMDISKSVEVKYFKTELEMLISWFDELNQFDPDIITGFNVFKFDLCFLHLRARYLIEQEHSEYKNITFGRVPQMQLEEKVVADLFQNKFYFNLKEVNNLYSKIHSLFKFQNYFRMDIKIFETYGRQVIDCSWYFNHTHPFVPSNQRRLKDWAKRYLNEDSQKLDISYDQFAEYLYSKDIIKRSLLGEYNIRDSEIVQELFLKFDILGYYNDMGYLNHTLASQYHNKNFNPVYFQKINEICQSKNQFDLQNDCLVIKSNQQEQWDKIQEYISSLSKLQKVEFNINADTSPLIFKQIVKLQENLQVENFSFKLDECIQNLPFKLSPLVQNLHSTQTKALSIQANSDSKKQEIDLIDSLLNLPQSLSFCYIQLNSNSIIINQNNSINKVNSIKCTNLNKIVINFNNFQEPKVEFTEFLGQFFKMQDKLEAIDLIFQYDKTNNQFIQNMIKSIFSNSKFLKILNLTIKGNNELKNSSLKESQNSSNLIEDVLLVLEKYLNCIEKIFFNYTDIKLNSLNDNIFISFGKTLSSLKLFVFKIEEEKKFLKNNFYKMIKLLKERN